MDGWLIVARGVHFAATITVAGVVAFVVLIVGPALRDAKGDSRLATFVRPWLARLAWIGLVLAVLSGALWLVLVAAAMSGRPFADVLSDGTVWIVLRQTTFGHDWLARFVLACLLAVALVPLLSRRRTGSRALEVSVDVLAVLAAAAFAGLLAFAGHAAGGIGEEAIFHPAADALHLIAAAAWVGSLVPLTLLLAAAGRDPASVTVARAATRRYSTLGIVSVATLLFTGIINTRYLVGNIAALTGTAYGRLVLVKIVLFFGMVGIAAINRMRLTPRLAPGENTPAAADTLRQLRRNSVVEVAVGATIIAVVAVLGVTPPPAHGDHETPAHQHSH